MTSLKTSQTKEQVQVRVTGKLLSPLGSECVCTCVLDEDEGR